MKRTLEAQVNSLAYHLWLSAGREYRRVVDFWIMAEQMVWELAVATTRLSGSAMEAGSMIERTAPAIAATYLQRVQELAYFMWETSGAQCGRAMEFWLAAERHVMTMMIVSGHRATATDAEQDVGQDSDDDQGLPAAAWLGQFSAEAYLNEIRRSAYYLWEKAGGYQGSDPLSFWLAAERQVLHRIEEEARTQDGLEGTENTSLNSPQSGSSLSEHGQRPEAGDSASAAYRDAGEARPVTEPSPLRIRRREAPQDLHAH